MLIYGNTGGWVEGGNEGGLPRSRGGGLVEKCSSPKSVCVYKADLRDGVFAPIPKRKIDLPSIFLFSWRSKQSSHE